MGVSMQIKVGGCESGGGVEGNDVKGRACEGGGMKGESV